MQPTERLSFISRKTPDEICQLWNNCFAGHENWLHMTQHIPLPFRPNGEHAISMFLQRSGTWLIKRNEEQDIIGFLSHGDFLPKMPNNIGFNIGLSYTGNGYASEALSALLQHLRTNGFTETFGHCLESNVGSIRTMEKCGFVSLGSTGNPYEAHRELKFRVQL